MIRAAVFDLDNTLYDSTTIPRELLAPAASAVRRANTGPDAIPAEVLESAIEAARRFGFLAVAERRSLPAFLRAAWREEYQHLRITTPLYPYPDVLPALETLDLLKLLLTTGFRGIQEGKIAALDIAPMFHGIYIDTLDHTDRLDGGNGPGKRRLLEEILATYRLAPPEVLVIGDSPENEIAAGNALGAVTVQILRPGVEYSDSARHHIETLADLPPLVRRLDASPA
jgi:putative hydrolase of the HAD superfamily